MQCMQFWIYFWNQIPYYFFWFSPCFSHKIIILLNTLIFRTREWRDSLFSQTKLWEAPPQKFFLLKLIWVFIVLINALSLNLWIFAGLIMNVLWIHPAKFWKLILEVTHYQQMSMMKRVEKLPSKAHPSHWSKSKIRSVIKGHWNVVGYLFDLFINK